MRADNTTLSIISAISQHRFVLCLTIAWRPFKALARSGFCQRKRVSLFRRACPSPRSRPGQSGWRVMSFSHAGSNIRAFVIFRRSRSAITFIPFGLLHRVTLTQSSRLGSRKHILLASNVTSNERSNQPMKPTDAVTPATLLRHPAVAYLFLIRSSPPPDMLG